MTGTRRAEVVRAAVEVVGRGGSRALTHGAVDAAAGVAAGTTSNHFRTRDALVRGVLEHILEAESDHYAVVGERRVEDGIGVGEVERVVQEAGAMLRYLAGPGRHTALARHAISLEAAWRPELRSALARGRQKWRHVATQLLSSAAVADPERYAGSFLACLDGLLLDELRQPGEGFEPEPVIRALLTGLRLGSSVSSPQHGAGAGVGPH